jgi:hypothetical protein
VPPSIPVSQHGECVDDLCSGSAAQDAVPESDQVVPTYPSRGRSWRVVEEWVAGCVAWLPWLST